ncbi:hypothetical protein HanIR_Chr05g0235621 [Helianthus annuus]|nr:hypothetical protein HanIR_Chr05g0235621 [Helianthus annuus]
MDDFIQFGMMILELISIIKPKSNCKCVPTSMMGSMLNSWWYETYVGYKLVY